MECSCKENCDYAGWSFSLYLITDRKLLPKNCSLELAVEQALEGGLKAVQLREKNLATTTRDLLRMAEKMRELTSRYNAKLFINDRLDIALAVEADGLHLATTSMPTDAVRQVTGKNFLIGVSTHNMTEARLAAEKGADFITFGPIYGTPSKLSYGKPVGLEVLREVAEKVSIPVFALGGVKLERVEKIKRYGSYGVALISDILTSDNIKERTEQFLKGLQAY